MRTARRITIKSALNRARLPDSGGPATTTVLAGLTLLGAGAALTVAARRRTVGP